VVIATSLKAGVGRKKGTHPKRGQKGRTKAIIPRGVEVEENEFLLMFSDLITRRGRKREEDVKAVGKRLTRFGRGKRGEG